MINREPGDEMHANEEHWRSMFENSPIGIALTTQHGFFTAANHAFQPEAALRESEERFRNMADTAPVMIWMSGLDKLCTFFNKPWVEFTGRTLEEELGNGWTDGVYAEDLDRCLAVYSSSFDARAAFQMQYRLRRADGEYRWVLDNGTPIYRGGEFAGFIGSCVDITEQKLTEERLRASEARLIKAQHLANVGSWERELATDSILWSDEALRILGVSDSAPSNFLAFLKCVHPDDREQLLEADHKIRSTKVLADAEYRIIRPNGEVRLLRSIAEAIRDEGVPVRIVGATQDLTDVKRAQQQDFVRQKMESLGTLASGIAHDFNNLMSSVLGRADLALDECEAGLSPKEELKGIREVALRGCEIVRQLMIYAGEPGGDVELVDVSAVIEEMLEFLKASVLKRARIDADLREYLPEVRVNAGLLRQVVMNLVTNACDALGDRDGVIRVATNSVTVGGHASDATSTGLPEGDYIRLEVSDNGQGMTQETQDKVFDPFFTTKATGHGLGLAIVHGIVRNAHGAVRVTSEPDKGSKFQVFLPCALKALEATRTTIARSAAWACSVGS